MSADALRRQLVAELVERGDLTPEWRPAFDQVARHAFIPDTIWVHDPATPTGEPDMAAVRRADDPDGWLRAAYADEAVVIQVDDGHPAGPALRGREVSSSASQPAIVARMLAALRAEPGMRVLEIGTGTGWNAALLAHHLGAGNVTSVEIDPGLAEHARDRLTAAGYAGVTVISGDGVQGWPAGALYERLLATVAAWQVPHAWVRQTRVGGEILLPTGTHWLEGGLLRLTVTGPGVARGHIIGSAGFMQLREQRLPRWTVAEWFTGDGETTTTKLHPAYVTRPDAATAIGFRVPGCQRFFGSRSKILYLFDRGTRSWATVQLADQPPYEVEQFGPRHLWDEVRAAYRWWKNAGKPDRGAWTITVDQHGQHAELEPAPVA
ncbi:MAG: methyltransferase domain-containing protein [Pseudonocardiaceae bacterium]